MNKDYDAWNEAEADELLYCSDDIVLRCMTCKREILDGPKTQWYSLKGRDENGEAYGDLHSKSKQSMLQRWRELTCTFEDWMNRIGQGNMKYLNHTGCTITRETPM